MASHTQQLIKSGLVNDAPPFLGGAIQYEVVMGSVAYGVSSDTSDFDVYGFAIAPKEDAFPHLRGEIAGFDECQPTFKHYQKHHIYDANALGGRGRTYDVTVYAVARYFQLLMDNNPNIIDTLYVPRNCVLHCTPVGEMVREQRRVFLHKGCWPKFKGYAYNQLHKIRTKNPKGKRQAIVEQFGYDVKFAYHVVRLINEVEQLLVEGELDLQRSSEQLKSIRRGEWPLQRLEQYVIDKERELESAYGNSSLPVKPDVAKIRQLLLACYEQYFGSLDKVVTILDQNTKAIMQIRHILDNLKE